MPLKVQVDEMPALNLTSMIDVAFLLVIFFMLGTRFTTNESRIAVQVPQVKDVKSTSAAPAKRTISVHRDGRISLDQQIVTMDELTHRLIAERAQNSRLSVIIRGDAEGAFQHVAEVLAACRHAGVADLGISVRLAKKEP